LVKSRKDLAELIFDSELVGVERPENSTDFIKRKMYATSYNNII